MTKYGYILGVPLTIIVNLTMCSRQYLQSENDLHQSLDMQGKDYP